MLGRRRRHDCRIGPRGLAMTRSRMLEPHVVAAWLLTTEAGLVRGVAELLRAAVQSLMTEARRLLNVGQAAPPRLPHRASRPRHDPEPNARAARGRCLVANEGGRLAAGCGRAAAGGGEIIDD